MDIPAVFGKRQQHFRNGNQHVVLFQLKNYHVAENGTNPAMYKYIGAFPTLPEAKEFLQIKYDIDPLDVVFKGYSRK